MMCRGNASRGPLERMDGGRLAAILAQVGPFCFGRRISFSLAVTRIRQENLIRAMPKGRWTGPAGWTWRKAPSRSCLRHESTKRE
nr:MAG TPA: hypothetical protein [Caudoviricetes sp.]